MKASITENISRLIESTGLVSNTDSIFVVGKGPSIDEVAGMRWPAGLIINVNDSEKIVQGHLGIFSANWVRHSLKEKGFKCQYYLAGKPLPAVIQHDVLTPMPIEYDDDDLVTFRLSTPEFFDEPFVLVNAIKAAVEVARQTKRKPNVYLLGFDFSTQQGEVSKNLGIDFAKDSNVDRGLFVHSQEFSFHQISRFFEDNPVINLVHVGSKEYSKLSVQQFLEKFGGKTSKPPVSSAGSADEKITERVIIVAEFTNNHLGDLNRLVEMIQRAREGGADLIKIQKRHVDTFYSADKLKSYYWSPFGRTLRDYRMGVELQQEGLRVLDDTCKAVGIGWFCSILDYASYEQIKVFNPKMIKIPSTISNHRDFHKKMAANFKGPIVVSTGLTDQSYEDYVLDTFSGNEMIYLLHCISAYPTSLQDCNVAVVSHYNELRKRHPKVIPGYSSHDLGSLASVLAVAAGARMIEKHVKLGDVPWVHFDTVALDMKTDAFNNFVRTIRDAEKALGSPIKQILRSEHHKYEVVN